MSLWERFCDWFAGVNDEAELEEFDEEAEREARLKNELVGQWILRGRGLDPDYKPHTPEMRIGRGFRAM